MCVMYSTVESYRVYIARAGRMETGSSGRSPREEGELEDGEICDDEPENKQQQARWPNARRRPHTSTPRGPAFRPAAFPPSPCVPERPDMLASRTSFWERSHRALGKLRYQDRAMQCRPERAPGPGRGRNPYRRETLNWKQNRGGRTAGRKPPYIGTKAENLDESFEDLLMKYKQIQLELECIRNQEKRAFKSSEASQQGEQEQVTTDALPPEDTQQREVKEKKEQVEERKGFQAFNLRPLRKKLLTPAERDTLNSEHTTMQEVLHKEDEVKEENQQVDEPPTPNDSIDAEEEEDELESDLNISLNKESKKTRGKEEDDELSELQLRLLALQSASQRWHQKEQQVMKESKEKLNRAKITPEHSRVTTRSVSAGRGRLGVKGQEKSKATGRPGTESIKPQPKGQPAKHTVNPALKQAWRKQQVRTWKLQQAQRQKNEEDEEKRKREEEIRKIRDLSNQEEQYNRFMKLVGGKLLAQTNSKLSDSDYRKCIFDSAGNLYQYDNYDEVAMDTDSETNSPAVSPAHEPFGYLVPPFDHLPDHMFSINPTPVQQCPLDSLGGGSLLYPPPPPPLPPPDELEPPPKPPFADEEEEEEMMLREELLKSLATKRAGKPDDSSSNSGPPSPIRPVILPAFKGTVSSAGFSSSSTQSRTSKVGRGTTASRVPLKLPRHKTVVVCLNASDDSDSEIEATSSAHCVLGGLESMIKEARRTAEATRLRPVPTAEKENNPLRTPTALPESKKIEYRLLRGELISRENQRINKSNSAVSASTGLALATTGEKASDLSTTEDKLIKHRAQLQKDQLLLQQLHQQELRKKESLKVAETKVARLKEQLLAAERVAGAHRVLLKKHQEQVQRVHDRISVKKQQALRMERELLNEQSGTVKEGYSQNTQLSMGKRRRLDVPDGYYVDLMEQKKRLQQLESEYALKIQKLKEAQALRQATNSIVPCTITQPSLHDLTQDKLTLVSDDAGDEPEPDGVELQPAHTSTRRRSFRESGSFTKPNLSHAEMTTPSQAHPVPLPKQTTVNPPPPVELPLLGLNIDDLRLRFLKSDSLEELLQREVCAVGEITLHALLSQKAVQVDCDPMAPQQVRNEIKPVPFGQYHSPLLLFKSYRFSPYFRTKEKLSLSSVSFSNTIEPHNCFCRFDLTGTCNDDDCQWQHMRNCTLNGNQLFQDILSYSLPLIGCSDESSTSDISRATEKYLRKLFGGSKDRMSSDQKAVLLLSKVNESLQHVPPYTTYKQKRNWKPEPQKPKSSSITVPEGEEENITLPAAPESDGLLAGSWTMSDVCITPDDKRYFDSETDDISNLEYSVLDSPGDRQLWIKLAYRYLNQKDVSVSECMDAALNTLSRALEDNRGDEELWCHYLTLFSRRGSSEDVREMCDMAVEHAAHYSIWCTYLGIESTFEGKDAVCKRMLRFLMEDSKVGSVKELRSFQLLETLLCQAQLSVHTGRLHNARGILQKSLTSEAEDGISRHLTLSHRSVAWLCYIHLCEFETLPSQLFDPSNSTPSRIVNLEPFLLPWSCSKDIRSQPDILIALFQDAISHCVDDSVSPVEQTLACVQLHVNLLHLLKVLGRLQEATELCEHVLCVVPFCYTFLENLSELHTAAGAVDSAVIVWLQAHKLQPSNARLFYSLSKCLHKTKKLGELDELFKQFVFGLCDDVKHDLPPVTLLRSLLGLQSNDLQRPSVSLSHHLHSQLPYLHLLHCFWQSVRGSVAEAVEAFEAALGAASDLEVVHKIWFDYLLFTSSKMSGRDLRMFGELVQRCLNTVPTRITVPYSSATYWSCFTFHNRVLKYYLTFLPATFHSSALERFKNAMPTNTELGLRFLQQEWIDGNVENMKLQARMMSVTLPFCLSVWKILIALSKEKRARAEVQKMYQQALLKLPLCATLWKDWLLFEAAAGGKTDTLNKLVVRCQTAGVSLSEALSVHSPTPEPP